VVLLLNKLTVVIAEDQEIDRLKLEHFANELDLKVLSSTGTGEWFVEDCLKFHPDLVFLDIGLQGLDGISAYKKLLESGQIPYLIMVSGTQDHSLVLAGLEMNCIDFVTKPVTLDRLGAAVKKANTMIEKDRAYSVITPGKILKVKSNYRTYFINEDKLIYAQKLKGEHKTIIYVEGENESGIETSASLADIQSQCSEYIFTPNKSNLVNIKHIKSIYASYQFLGTYVIKLSYNDVEIDLSRRKKKQFEQLYPHLT
jgi:DNA-binding LytR/AlgR family response regulator